MTLWYIIAFGLSGILTFSATRVVRKIAVQYNIVDRPNNAPDRKIHTQPTPLLGGVAIFLGFTVATIIIALFSHQLIGDGMPWKYIIGIILGGGLIVFGGARDDRYNLPAKRQIIWPVLAAMIVVATGIGIDTITNPLGGSINLHQYDLPVVTIGQTVFALTLWADVFALCWLLGSMYTTKFLDGLDGLVSSMTAIGSIFIFIVSLSPDVHQPGTALLAALLAGACLGFIPFNWHPARIFLGEGGSVFLGFMLGVLSIIAGSKIATALLIIGIPALDVVWIICRRLFIERRSPFQADRKHLHFRLLDVGLSHRGAVAFLLVLSSAFGLAGLFATGKQKLLTFGILVIFMLLLGLGLVLIYRLKQKKQADSDRPLDKFA